MSVAPETTGSAPLLARDPSSAARRRSVQRFLDALAFVVVLVALWQLVYWKSEIAITGPLETVETAAALLGSENFWRNALATGRAFGASLILSCVGGVAIGRYALGQRAYGKSCLGLNRQDPEAIEFFVPFVPGLRAAVTTAMPVIPISGEKQPQMNADERR